MAHQQMKGASRRAPARPGGKIHVETILIVAIFAAAWINALWFIG